MFFIKTILLLFTLSNFAWTISTKREAANPQQECIEECKREGKSTNCEKSCTVLTPMERHVTPLLEANCVKQCNGGDVTAENPLKPECEQKCLFKEPSPVLMKRAAENEEPGCKTECSPTEDGKGKECKTTCIGKTGGIGGRVSGPLNKTCVDECNGGVMPTKLEELKPGCEEKCAFKGPIVVYQKKTEFASKEACLQYCQEKGLGHSEEECNQKCQRTFSGIVQG